MIVNVSSTFASGLFHDDHSPASIIGSPSLSERDVVRLLAFAALVQLFPLIEAGDRHEAWTALNESRKAAAVATVSARALIALLRNDSSFAHDGMSPGRP